MAECIRDEIGHDESYTSYDLDDLMSDAYFPYVSDVGLSSFGFPPDFSEKDLQVVVSVGDGSRVVWNDAIKSAVRTALNGLDG